VQAAVLEQLLGDVDDLVGRVERLAPELHAAADRLDESTRTSQAAFEASTAAAKASVGEWITQRTNEATTRALQEHLQAIDAAVAASVGRATLSLAQLQAKPSPRNDRLWLGAALGAATCAAVLGIAAVLLR
jgi:hypothetical protein